VAVSPATRAFVLELFDGLPRVSLRAMMGGLAVYSDGRIFALVTSDERFWLKAAGDFAERLAAEGSEQFAYTRRGGVTARMGYWSLPEAALDDPQAASDWARSALDAARD
jgi:DNA transformation protein